MNHAPAPTPPTAQATSSYGRILGIWLLLGLQSFGGGGATLTLIRRAVVEQERWLTEAEFSRDWALCQIAPGINLLALCILVGRRIAGVPGICFCLFGLLLPSVSITVLLTAVYARIRDLSLVRAALQAVIPASVGLGLLTAYNMVLPPLRASRRESRVSWLFGATIVALSGGAMLTGRVPVVLILAGAGLASALFQMGRARRKPIPEDSAA